MSTPAAAQPHELSPVFVTTAYGGPEHQELTTRPIPEPRAGEMTIAVRAAGVNPADVKRREGAFGTSGALPQAMGLEAAGVVTALGEGVTRFALGDAVLGGPARGRGAFAGHTVLRASDAALLPEGVPFEVAATLPVAGTTSFDLVHHLDLAPGASVLVLGAGGGVGHLVLQIAAARGLSAVGVASASKRTLIEGTGARFVPSGASAPAAARALLPTGADLLIDLVGGEPLRALAPLAASHDSLVSAADEAAASALGGSGRRRRDDALAGIVALVASGQVTPQIVDTYPLARATEAIARVEAGHLGGKIVILP